MRIGRLFAVTLTIVGVVVGGTSFAQSGQDPIVVIEVDGPMDQRSIDFVAAAILGEDAHAYILKIDSPGVSSGDLTRLYETVVEAPAPVISWIGASPAVAYGGAAYLANHADIRTAAPGAVVGYLDPAVQRGEAEPPSTRPGDDPKRFSEIEQELALATRVVDPVGSTIYGFVDRLEPALGQLIISLDGERVVRGDQVFELSTARTETVDGAEVLIATRPVRFVKAGLLDRFLRLGARPETAFLFLLFGLAFAIFEFYAAGSGLMAFVASLALILSGYGLATLPIWWPAMAALGLGFGLLIWGFVQNRVDWRAVVGSILLLGAGLTFTTTRPQYPPAWLMVVLTVAGAVTFVWYALTTVVRGRFATPTVGRESMLGQRCLAVTELHPLGVVLVDGARWRATADRGVQIAAGVPVEIVGVTGLLLEVDPVVLNMSSGEGREDSP
ncbi:MAG: hypothetical protein BMS9Abin17_1254 [Acidimicrobiia bacterium]|nr:MAG: hypothetical protein BMS9Abin17_1254 [Acidimicrobiia bacterium]